MQCPIKTNNYCDIISMITVQLALCFWLGNPVYWLFFFNVSSELRFKISTRGLLFTHTATTDQTIFGHLFIVSINSGSADTCFFADIFADKLSTHYPAGEQFYCPLEVMLLGCALPCM